MTKLSPAAQAVKDAWDAEWPDGLAAALRAAADHLNHSTSAHTLYAIADELEQEAPINTTETP
jgi:hypothetical protein